MRLVLPTAVPLSSEARQTNGNCTSLCRACLRSRHSTQPTDFNLSTQWLHCIYITVELAAMRTTLRTDESEFHQRTTTTSPCKGLAYQHSLFPTSTNSKTATHTQANNAPQRAAIVFPSSSKSPIKPIRRLHSAAANQLCATCKSDFSPLHLENVPLSSLPISCIRHAF